MSADFPEVAVVVTDINNLPFCRERNQLVRALAMESDQPFGCLSQAYGLIVAEIEDLPARVL